MLWVAVMPSDTWLKCALHIQPVTVTVSFQANTKYSVSITASLQSLLRCTSVFHVWLFLEKKVVLATLVCIYIMFSNVSSVGS